MQKKTHVQHRQALAAERVGSTRPWGLLRPVWVARAQVRHRPFAARLFSATVHAWAVAPDSRSKNPGPGDYEFADQFHDVTRHELPKWRFPVAARHQGGARDNTGPGDYDPGKAHLVQKPRWTHGLKREEQRETHPDVGATYSQFA